MTNNKCKHSACNCVPPFGEGYCSASCKDAKATTEACQCQHQGCRGEALKH